MTNLPPTAHDARSLNGGARRLPPEPSGAAAPSWLTALAFFLILGLLGGLECL